MSGFIGDALHPLRHLHSPYFSLPIRNCIILRFIAFSFCPSVDFRENVRNTVTVVERREGKMGAKVSLFKCKSLTFLPLVSKTNIEKLARFIYFNTLCYLLFPKSKSCYVGIETKGKYLPIFQSSGMYHLPACRNGCNEGIFPD